MPTTRSSSGKKSKSPDKKTAPIEKNPSQDAEELEKHEEEEPVIVNKWDDIAVKNALDDSVRKIINDNFGWVERHTLTDGRLMLSTFAVGVALFAMGYDYFNTFPKSKNVLSFCSVFYFVMIFVLQFYQWYVEKLTFFQAIEKDGDSTRYWNWSSDLKRYDHHYDLIAEFTEGNKYGHMKVTKSITSYITEEGEVLLPVLKKEVDALRKNLLKKD